MKSIACLLFQARMLKGIERTGYPFLGAGRENVAEHSFIISFIAYVMSKMVPEADAQKLVLMCLVHDLPESMTGDLNYVNKKYVIANEELAISDTVKDLPFGDDLSKLMLEFNSGKTLESRLAHDADQLALLLDLKHLLDTGYTPPERWIASIQKRLQTETGKTIAKEILTTEKDEWWLKNYVDTGISTD